jgi:RNA polymerase-associated protein CTR9
MPNAINTFQLSLDKQPNCVEAHVGLAVIHFHASQTAMSTGDREDERKKATEHYEAVTRFLVSAGARQSATDPILLRRISKVADDPDLFVEMAKLYTAKQPAKALEHYQTSLEVRQSHIERGSVTQRIPPQLLNNIGCLLYTKRNFQGAKESFQDALTATRDLEGQEQEAVLMTVSYNLAMTHEALDDKEQAMFIYKSRILERHPEFVEAKARLALMHIARREYIPADELIKEALSSASRNPEIRALYTFYNVRTGNDRIARDFTTVTVRDHYRLDVYGHCALGMIVYTQAREMKPKEGDTAEMQKKLQKFFRSAEFYDKALRLDPNCSYAAMGLAIALAEGSLMPTSVARDPAKRNAAQARNTRDAINILTKVRETMANTSDTSSAASVYVNLGHAHATRDEWDKAIESVCWSSSLVFGLTQWAVRVGLQALLQGQQRGLLALLVAGVV